MDEQVLIALSAYIDGELLEPECAALETQLAAAGELQRLRQTFQRLDGAAAELGLPRTHARLTTLWPQVAALTVTVPKHVSRRLDKAASELSVPDLGRGVFDWMWGHIVKREPASQTALSVPPVSAERWDSVWDGVVRKTDFKLRRIRPEERKGYRRILRIARRWWPALAAGVALAVLAGVAALWLREVPPEEDLVAVEVPEVLHEDYQVQVKYVRGQSTPVLCFFLKPGVDPDRE